LAADFRKRVDQERAAEQLQRTSQRQTLPWRRHLLIRCEGAESRRDKRSQEVALFAGFVAETRGYEGLASARRRP
jgi:hypothetical protein